MARMIETGHCVAYHRGKTGYLGVIMAGLRWWGSVPGYLIIALGVLFLLDTMGLLNAGWILATF